MLGGPLMFRYRLHFKTVAADGSICVRLGRLAADLRYMRACGCVVTRIEVLA